MTKVLCVILTVDENRMKWMKEEFAAMKCPFPVEIFIGHTPTDSKEYINDRCSSIPEFDETLCCMRSYASLMNKYKSRKDYDYLITFEDDVLLHKDFFKEIYDVIYKFEKYTENEYVLLGYNLKLDIAKIRCYFHEDGGFFHNVWRYPDIWGAMAMLFRPSAVEKIANAFHKLTSKDVRESITVIKKLNIYNTKGVRVQADVAIPLLCKYALVYPPLAIESPSFNSTITGFQNTQYAFYSRHPDIKLEQYGTAKQAKIPFRNYTVVNID